MTTIEEIRAQRRAAREEWNRQTVAALAHSAAHPVTPQERASLAGTLEAINGTTTCDKHTSDVTCAAAHAAYDFDSDTWR